MTVRQELRSYPFFRILLPLVLGIVVGNSFLIAWREILLLGTVGLVGLICYSSLPYLWNSYRWQSGFGILFFFVLFSLGVGLVQRAEKNMELPLKSNQKVVVLASIARSPRIKEKTVQCLLQLKSIRADSIWRKTDAKLLVYLQKDSLSCQLATGMDLMFNGRVQRIKNRGNPNEFDFARYMRNQHVLFSCYVKSGEWMATGVSDPYSLKKLSAQWRKSLLAIYSENGITDDAYGVLSALTLGYKDALSPETREVWASAGAIHVLAVSGLHVGIIFVVLNSFLKFLTRIRYGASLRAVILLAVLWLYAFLTGLSPSVLRATTMFTFIVVGQLLNRSGTIYNSLAASAFLLLLIDPFLLFTVGFQLSYLAVLAIVFFQPRIYNWWNPNNYFLNRVWALTSVSLAAQLGTFPLSMYYFHQFPNYFLLTNLVVIFMAALLIYMVLALFLFSQIEVIAHALSWLVKLAFRVMDGSVRLVKQLPGAVWEGIQLDTIQVFEIYLLIILISIFLLLKKPGLVLWILGIVFLFQIPTLVKLGQSKELSEFTIYNVSGRSVYSFMRGEQTAMYLDSLAENGFVERVLTAHSKALGPHLQQSRDVARLGTGDHFNSFPEVRAPFCSFGDQLIVFIRNVNCKEILLKQPIPVDFLVLGGQSKCAPEDLQRVFKARTIVLDPSVSYRIRKRWKQYEFADSTCVYDVAEQGAFRILTGSVLGMTTDK